jgi:hypothetical protein
MTTTSGEADNDLSEADLAALTLAVDLTLADDPPDPGRVEQVESKLRGEHGNTWLETAEFCSYHQQMERLGLAPWQQPPCWIIDREEADRILEVGPVPAMDGSGGDVSDCKCARLTKRMLQLGVSVFHPNPLAAIEAKRKKAAG